MRLPASLCFALILALTGASAAATPNSTLHPGDRLAVQVNGEVEISQKVVVADDGTIGLPLVGQVRVAGATSQDAGIAIATALKRYIRTPRVTVAVLDEGHVNVLILGDVVNSGEYALRTGARLSDAITAAGGMDPTINGEYPVARVSMAGGATYHISLDKLLRGGDPTRDIELADHAAIYVPGPEKFDVTVLGAVDHPGVVTVNTGDRLSLAIARAGSTHSSGADLSRVIVTRTEDDGKTLSHPVDLFRSIEKGDARFDPRLRKGDTVYVPIAKQSQGVLTNAALVLSRLIFFL